MDVFVWHDGSYRSGVKFDDGPPIFSGSSVDAFEEYVAVLKSDGSKVIRVDNEEDLEREIVFD